MEKESHLYCWVNYSFKDADIFFNPKQDFCKIEILFILFNIIYIDAWGLYLKN